MKELSNEFDHQFLLVHHPRWYNSRALWTTQGVHTPDDESRCTFEPTRDHVLREILADIISLIVGSPLPLKVRHGH